MFPFYKSSDIAGIKVLRSRGFFQSNKVYAIATEQGIFIKHVKQGKDKNTLTMVSANPDFPEFDIQLSDIKGIGLVLGYVRVT